MMTAAAIATRADLSAGLRRLGINPGDTICFHVSMKSIGYVIGGTRSIVEGLIDAVGATGTIMMPTYSGDLSDPAEWRAPSVPKDRISDIRDALPPYDAVKTPTRGMGQVAEYFRSYPGVRRSPHPQSSFAAFGRHAKRLTAEHPLHNRFGPDSPLGGLVALEGKVVLVGAPFDTVSLFHLTNHYIEGSSAPIKKRSPVCSSGEKAWVEFEDIEYPADWFSDGVTHLISTRLAKTGKVGQANSVVFPAKESVSEIVEWRLKNGRINTPSK